MMYLVHFTAFVGYAVLAAGFVAFHFARGTQSLHLRVAGWVLVIGGVIGLSCILYYSLKYWRAGYFERPVAMMMPHPDGRMMQRPSDKAPEAPEHSHTGNE